MRGAAFSDTVPGSCRPVAVRCPLNDAESGDDDAELVRQLLAHGARADTRDTLWEATPLDWAIFLGRPSARAALEKIACN